MPKVDADGSTKQGPPPSFRTPKTQGPRNNKENKKLRHCSGTAQRAMSVEVLSIAAQLYETSHKEGMQ